MDQRLNSLTKQDDGSFKGTVVIEEEKTYSEQEVKDMLDKATSREEELFEVMKPYSVELEDLEDSI